MSSSTVLVVDASAMVEALLGSTVGVAVREYLRDHELHAPAHFPAEVLSALGRLQRAGHLAPVEVERAIEDLVTAPIVHHSVAPLLAGAWSRRHDIRLVDALYAELAEHLEARLVTTDARLAAVLSRARLLPRSSTE